MKGKIALILALILLVSTGCVSSHTAGGIQLDIYYCVPSDKAYGPSVQAETDSVPEASVPAIVDRLFEGPDSPELISIIPEGTTLQSWTLEAGNLKLDLSEAFGRLTGISLTRAEYCIALTLTQLDGVDTVSITVDGQMIPGCGVEKMSEKDVVLKGETQDPVTVSTQLYFPLADGSGLGVEYRVVEVASMEAKDQATAILQELIRGPSGEEMTGFLGGAGVIEVVAIEESTCVLAIDSATMESICNPKERFELQLYSIVDSLTELGTIETVAFLLDDAPIEGWADSYAAQYEF